MSIAALLIITRKWKEPKYSPTGKWINKMSYSCFVIPFSKNPFQLGWTNWSHSGENAQQKENKLPSRFLPFLNQRFYLTPASLSPFKTSLLMHLQQWPGSSPSSAVRAPILWGFSAPTHCSNPKLYSFVPLRKLYQCHLNTLDIYCASMIHIILKAKSCLLNLKRV